MLNLRIKQWIFKVENRVEIQKVYWYATDMSSFQEQHMHELPIYLVSFNIL